MMNNICNRCKKPFSKERAKLYKYCKDCSTEQPNVGIMEYGYRCGGEVVIIKNTEENKEQIEQALKFNKRGVTS